MDYDEARAAWVKDGMVEIDSWCLHIARRVRESIVVQSKGESLLPFDESEIVFDICAITNRLAQIAMRTPNHISTGRIAKWISETTGWPLHICEAFWSCIRHPTMHLGRSWGFADYGIKHDEIAMFADIAGSWRMSGPNTDEPWPAELLPLEGIGRGWWAIRGWDEHAVGDATSKNSLHVTFFMPGILLALSDLRDSVLRGLRVATPEELERLRELNARTGFWSSVNQPEVRLQELDLSDLESG